jgi:hypothetical protein
MFGKERFERERGSEISYTDERKYRSTTHEHLEG